METYLLDWLHLLLRWTHIVVGAAWIGASFYFVHLNNSLRPLKEPKDGVTGEMFAIHGGGYYHMHKLDPRMEKLPEPLHWFKWEAYTTWLTGIGLLIVVYYLQASAFLVGDDISAGAAVGVGVGSLVVGWLVYDGLCRTPLLTMPRLFGLIGLILMTGSAYLLCQLLNPRAAYIHVGAMIGTMMAGNVFFTIIPRQRAMVEATLAGKEADPQDGKLGAYRSLHNNYLTLPVLLVMVSNHFGALYGHAWNWALLIAVAVCGAILKHWFNLHGQGKPAPIWIWFVAGLGIVGVCRRLDWGLRSFSRPVARRTLRASERNSQHGNQHPTDPTSHPTTLQFSRKSRHTDARAGVTAIKNSTHYSRLQLELFAILRTYNRFKLRHVSRFEILRIPFDFFARRPNCQIAKQNGFGQTAGVVSKVRHRWRSTFDRVGEFGEVTR